MSVAAASAFSALQSSPFEESPSPSQDGNMCQAPSLPLQFSLPEPLPSLARTSSGKLLERAKSAGATTRPSLNPFRARPSVDRPTLWRDSTAVSDKASELGLKSLEDLCGETYIDSDRLKKGKPLGEGAFATVEMARLAPDPCGTSDDGQASASGSQAGSSAGQVVAVKRLKAHVLELEADVINFVAETRLLLRLNNPNIINYIGLGCEDHSCREAQWRTMFLVQEYGNCGTLKKRLLDQLCNPMKQLYSLQDALRWSTQIAEGLAYLHSVNPMVIHRDLKAENILLVGDPKAPDAKIGDFGLSKLVKLPGKTEWSFFDIAEEHSGSQHSTGHGRNEAFLALQKSGSAGSNGMSPVRALSPTGLLPVVGGDSTMVSTGRRLKGGYMMTGKTGAFVYMAPEVLLSRPYSEKVDVFSFGVIMYEVFHRTMIMASLMHTGDPGEAEEHAYRVAAGHRLPLDQSLPEELRHLINDCWAGLPELRPSMPEVVSRLQAIQEAGLLDHASEAGSRAGSVAVQGCSCAIM